MRPNPAYFEYHCKFLLVIDLQSCGRRYLGPQQAQPQREGQVVLLSTLFLEATKETPVDGGRVTPGRFLRGWKGYSRTAALCHPMGGLPQLGVAGQTREGCRSTIELRFATILNEGNACQAKRGRTKHYSTP